MAREMLSTMAVRVIETPRWRDRVSPTFGPGTALLVVAGSRCRVLSNHNSIVRGKAGVVAEDQVVATHIG